MRTRTLGVLVVGSGLALAGCFPQTDKQEEETRVVSGDNGGCCGKCDKCDQCDKCDCRPLTCKEVGANCGTISDGCGGTIGCGSCREHEVCGGGGVANVCGNPCEEHEKMCDDHCIDVTTDVAHCGACGNACDLDHAVAACRQGKCKIDHCDRCFADCDCDPANGCEVNLKHDVAHCGACGHACKLAHATATCTEGECAINTCDSEFADCDNNPANGCEADLDRDRDNCGACGVDCPTGTICVEGICTSGAPDGGAPAPI